MWIHFKICWQSSILFVEVAHLETKPSKKIKLWSETLYLTIFIIQYHISSIVLPALLDIKSYFRTCSWKWEVENDNNERKFRINE